MKILRFGEVGFERPGILIEENTILDLGDAVGDLLLDPNWPTVRDHIQQIVENSPAGLPRLPFDGQRIGPPLARFGKIICVGLNYRAHAAEVGSEPPEEPVLFMKATDTIIGPSDPVEIPHGSTKTDYEVELAVVIGSRAWRLSDPSQSVDHIMGYMISNDVSEREYQLERGGQWMKGKNCPTFNPSGPWIATNDEIPDPQDLDLRLTVNGEARQSSNTSDMVFDVQHLVWYISQFMALEPGDVINTGTPQGVGIGQSPPTYLRPGDIVELSIAGLGHQRQEFVDGTGVIR
ncbi:MAG: fumarylacetoacetate hydrolase family protein [Acidimicrobiia bacterium]|nr:MAG: fumarylacetoacetate hydrolase family protein [Acidimicrobiia bacterium]